MSTGSEVTPSAHSPYARTYESTDEVIEVFRPVMRAIAAAGGPSCEVVLHDLSGADVDLGHTIIAIENGQVTGRDVGGPSTNLGVGVLHDQSADHDAFGYRGVARDGRELRCSSIYFRNTSGAVIAALCINVDLSPIQQAKALLDGLAPSDPPGAGDRPHEFIESDLVSVMDAMIAEAIRLVGKPVEQMNRDDRMNVLMRLDKQGALQMKKSVERIGARLGISRVTAYAYLDEARNRTSAVSGD
ncbi:helix-turn-helix transcriptional regulator [Spelaeicoccus albus]|uniref:Putative transcriptional regulator YheO n=1 Tax=Spelaeicoccus albus TaxID=1280376 RepID=A0A7Z0D1M6_9MICO|nr:helix-turn-helix transcriptional regulator [Spelaeicoccus albus]NYI67313.1 putative transcriptional regulator YheO [Spelaeicoccus albus]